MEGIVELQLFYRQQQKRRKDVKNDAAVSCINY